MSLAPGARLGPYEVLAAIGVGGMGEVYRARDSKLNRDVALKILPESFANDSERLARFQREAQVLASLNHQNIGAIYGLEDGAGVRALVLELVEGPTRADRIAPDADLGLPPIGCAGRTQSTWQSPAGTGTTLVSCDEEQRTRGVRRHDLSDPGRGT